MLITELKQKDEILSLAAEKTIIINCEGCKEVHFPEIEATQLQKELLVNRPDITVITTDYICNPGNLDHQLKKHDNAINDANAILVFSCGAGVQTVAGLFTGKNVYAACDTFPLPGYQGVTPQEYDCELCGQCYLNSTGGICPITACSKSLVNGQCGGSKDGKCEVDKDMPCGWDRIHERLRARKLRETAAATPATVTPTGAIKLRDFSVEV